MASSGADDDAPGALDARRGFDDAELAACLKVLRALGDRRTSSLVLAVSQLDKVAQSEAAHAEDALLAEFRRLRAEVGVGLGAPKPSSCGVIEGCP